MIDLYDAASEAAHRMGVALILLRHLGNFPRDTHGGFAQAVARELMQQSRDLLQSGMKSSESATAGEGGTV